MSRETDELEELSRGKKLACNITAAGIIVLAGVFLLLCGLNVIHVAVSKALCGTILFALGLLLLVSAIIQRNSVSLWLAVAFLVPALVELLVKTTKAGYAELYPLYIAIPAVSSLCTMMLTHEWATHLPLVILFGVSAGIFALKSSGVASWSVVLPVFVIFLGLAMLALALKRKREDE